MVSFGAPAPVNRCKPTFVERVRFGVKYSISVSVTRFWELCGARILGFAFKTYMAYSNLVTKSFSSVS